MCYVKFILCVLWGLVIINIHYDFSFSKKYIYLYFNLNKKLYAKV